MVASLELKSGAHVLRFSSDDSDWCAVSLCAPSGDVKLGADKLQVIKARLRSALESTAGQKNSGEIDGVKVHWVLSLSEQHCTLYAAELTKGLLLYVQDAYGNTIAKIELGASERGDWLRKLSAKP